MFILSAEEKQVSPCCMRFGDYWIYDLRSFHSFWKQMVLEENEVITAPNVWALMLKAYHLHLFTPLPRLQTFALDYHAHFKTKLSVRKIQEIFKIFSRLGLKKVGDLKRLTSAEVQKRFGKEWAFFMKGLLHPEKTEWKWQPWKKLSPLYTSVELDHYSLEVPFFIEALEAHLDKVAQNTPDFRVQKIEASLTLLEAKNSPTFEMTFTHNPLLKDELPWILRLMEERLQQIELSEPAFKIFLTLFPAEPPQPTQLTLFEDRSKMLAWRDVCQKLKDHNFQVFQPEALPSYLPESSWKKSSPLEVYSFGEHGFFRPLIQQQPQAIHCPEGALKFTERITWFDEAGSRHERDYFVTRACNKWIWVFKDEENKWFKQGTVE